MPILPPEIWSRILDHGPRRTARALYLTNRHLNQAINFSAYLFKKQEFLALIRFNPDYPPLHRYLTQQMEMDQQGIHENRRKRDRLLFRSLKTALVCQNWPLIELLTPVIRTRKARLILMGIVFDMFPSADVFPENRNCNLTREECGTSIAYFLNCWITNKDQINLFWRIMRQAFLWNAHEAVESCLHWLKSQPSKLKLKDAFFAFLTNRDPAMQTVLDVRENGPNELCDAKSEPSNAQSMIQEEHIQQNSTDLIPEAIESESPTSTNKTAKGTFEEKLRLAAKSGNLEVMRSSMSVNFEQCENVAPNFSLSNDHSDRFELLAGAPSAETALLYNDAFQLAVEHGHLDIAKLLMDDPRVDPAKHGNRAIRNASRNGHFGLVKLLLSDLRVNPGDGENNPIVSAACNGHIDVVALLLCDPRVNPSDFENGAIAFAAMSGHIEVVKLLLSDPRVNPDDCDNIAIRNASRNGHLDIVKLLMADSRVVPAGRENGAIQTAALNGHIDIVKLLMSDPRVDPSDRDDDAIQFASMNGHIDIVKLLMSDPRVDPAGKGNIAMMYAASNGHLEVVKLLLTDKRVDPSAYHSEALIRAAQNNHLELVKLLLTDPRLNLNGHFHEARLAFHYLPELKSFCTSVLHIPYWIIQYWQDYKKDV